uniref:Putative secreted protein n=1 Tax=Anopheles darlingi TaxID=43151 RepID=A0A2M4DAI0_ANODA
MGRTGTAWRKSPRVCVCVMYVLHKPPGAQAFPLLWNMQLCNVCLVDRSLMLLLLLRMLLLLSNDIYAGTTLQRRCVVLVQ